MNKASRYDRTVVAKRATKPENPGYTRGGERIMMTNTDNAPMIFADKVPVYGTVGDVVTVTLAAERPVGKNIEISATVHLRLTQQAARVLAQSLLDSLRMIDGNSADRAILN